VTLDLGRLLRPRSVAVVGANDDLSSFGGRIWHYLGQHSQLDRYAVNVRPGALGGARVAPSLKSLGTVPDVVVLATPTETISNLVSEAVSVGSKGIVVFGQVRADERAELRRVVDDSEMVLLGPASLGLIDANHGVVLSSSVSLERPLRGGPLALVAQSGALMGVLHSQALEQGIGLGFCVATGSQLQLRVEHVLAALSEEDGYLAVGAHLEDVDVDLFVEASATLAQAGRKLIVLKGGLTSRGSEVASGHSGALASDGRAFRALANDLGVVVVADPRELLACLHAATIAARTWHVVTVSGGLAAIATDLASDSGISLTTPAIASDDELLNRNPIDLESVPASPERNVALIEAVATGTAADGVVVVLNDAPDLDRLLSGIQGLDSEVKERLHLCSECSGQFDGLWREWVDAGGSYSDRLASFINSLAKTRDAGPSLLGWSGDGELVPTIKTFALLERAGIHVLETMAVDGVDDLEASAVALGLPFVLKLADVEHRGSVGVVTVGTIDEAAGAFRRLSQIGSVVAQPVAAPGLEFYVGVATDRVFGELFFVGAGGRSLEDRRDVSVSIGIPDPKAVLARLEETSSGGWLSSGLGSRLFDLEAFADVAARAGAFAMSMRPALVAMDLNPIVVNAAGVTVVDAKMHVKITSAARRGDADAQAARAPEKDSPQLTPSKPSVTNHSSNGSKRRARW
jgi:acyl-CoA synthetase (NDP forming)